MTLRRCIASFVLVFLAFVATAAVANAAQTRRIELVDGSVITGEVLSLSGGIYTVRSASLGTLRIKASDIRVIRAEGFSPRREQVNVPQNRMPGDAEIMALLRAMQNDPDLQKMLNDPEIIRAVQSGDIAAIMRNPEFRKLLDKYLPQDINKNPVR